MSKEARKGPPPRVAEFDAEFVRDISEAVYRERLGKNDAEAMEKEHGAARVRNNAGSYDVLTRAYLRATKAAGSVSENIQ
jgi:hypothetical protein